MQIRDGEVEGEKIFGSPVLSSAWLRAIAIASYCLSAASRGVHGHIPAGRQPHLWTLDVEDPRLYLYTNRGFAIECKEPGAADFEPLLNRIAFSCNDQPAGVAVTGDRKFDSREAPFQKFRWIHFLPPNPRDGRYEYRVTKKHMPSDDVLKSGTSLTLGLDLTQVTFDGLVDVGFTRNFASSQAYREQFGNNRDIIPALSEDGLDFEKIDLKNDRGESVYEWLGFEAYDHLFGFLDQTLQDHSLTIDVMAYDLNEPDIVARLEKFKKRLRVIIDNSTSTEKGKKIGHGTPHSPESVAAKRLRVTAGADAVKRTHFKGLHHHKVFIARRNGEPVKVLCGSTNFTFRGLYIQANNLLVFHAPQVADLFGQMFDLAFDDPDNFRDNPFAKTWHVAHVPEKARHPRLLLAACRDRSVAQPDPRGDRSGHVIRVLFGGVSRPDDPGPDGRSVPAPHGPAGFQLWHGRHAARSGTAQT